MSDERPLWALHCSEDIDLVGGGFAAVGWGDLGNLSALPANREAFKAAVAETWPEKKAGTLAQWAGQLYRFVHEAQEGDIVVYRERHGGPINIGCLAGPYYHAEGEI